MKRIIHDDALKEFLSQIWKQMGSLGVLYSESDGTVRKFRLFEDTETGSIPRKDEEFELLKGHSEELYHDVITRAKIYYRALGRIMFHTILNGHTIPKETIPAFFRNVIFRECEPKDNKYHDDILQQLHEIGIKIDPKSLLGLKVGEIISCDDLNEVSNNQIITKENFFTTVIQNYTVMSRQVSISSIKEGLTLCGAINLISLFCTMPLQVVTVLIFGK